MLWVPKLGFLYTFKELRRDKGHVRGKCVETETPGRHVAEHAHMLNSSLVLSLVNHRSPSFVCSSPFLGLVQVMPPPQADHCVS